MTFDNVCITTDGRNQMKYFGKKYLTTWKRVIKIYKYSTEHFKKRHQRNFFSRAHRERWLKTRQSFGQRNMNSARSDN